MAHLRIPARRAGYPVVHSGGLVFPDGTILEPVSTEGDPERLQLAKWDGHRATIAPQFEQFRKTYQPATLDPTILKVLFFPTYAAAADSARQLLDDIGCVVATYTNLPERCITLGTRFFLSTWFPHNFSTAPWLSIAGPDAVKGVQLLQLVRCFCRRAISIWDPSISGLCSLPRDWQFTLLVEGTELSSKVLSVIRATRRRGTSLLHQGTLVDIYAPCMTFTVDPCVPSAGALQAIEIPAIPDISGPTLLTNEAVRRIASDFQPRLLGYFFANNSAALPTESDISGLSFHMREVARNLIACTPGDASLQLETLEALKVQSDAARVTRWTDVECVLIESVLSMVHRGEREAYVGKIAKTAEDILEERGDQRVLNAKLAGTCLRGLQFRIEPRDRNGYRLVFTDEARRHLHELAYAFDVPTIQDGVVRCEHCRGGKNQVDAVVRAPKTRT